MKYKHQPQSFLKISDNVLLRRLTELLTKSRSVEAELVAHIGEVEARRLFASKASSMFVYSTEVLNLSEHEAYLRITVARAARMHPILLEMLADGSLHLSGIAKLVPLLTETNEKHFWPARLINRNGRSRSWSPSSLLRPMFLRCYASYPNDERRHRPWRSNSVRNEWTSLSESKQVNPEREAIAVVPNGSGSNQASGRYNPLLRLDGKSSSRPAPSFATSSIDFALSCARLFRMEI